MGYEKPKLIDLNEHSEKGYGQQMDCNSGSGAGRNCTTGTTAYNYCRFGYTAE